MSVPREEALVTVLVGTSAGALALQFIAKPMFVTWLRAHATVRVVRSPPGGRYSVAVHRYPRLGDIPELFGFGQGCVQR